MNLRLSLSLLLICCAVSVEIVPKIEVKGFAGNEIFGKIISDSPCRFYVLQNGFDSFSYEAAKESCKYVYSIEKNGDFAIHYSYDQLPLKPYIAFLAITEDGTKYDFVNYKIPKENYQCNENKIMIGKIVQTKDSCVFVTIKYTGNGALYLLNRIANTQVPDAFNIINEGVYLGVHPNQDVTTYICRVYENVKYTLYVTAVESSCIHLPMTYTYVADSFAPEVKWSVDSNPIWVSQNQGNVNHGVRYRRYGQVIYPGSVLRELDITPQGILVTPMSEALAKMREKSSQDAGMSDDVTNEILNDNVSWRRGSWESGTFSGLLLVFGKGNLYIYCSQRVEGVDIQDVVEKGKNVGFFEDDAVDITISGLSSDDYTIFAVLAYHNQYFGPFPKRLK